MLMCENGVYLEVTTLHCEGLGFLDSLGFLCVCLSPDTFILTWLLQLSAAVTWGQVQMMGFVLAAAISWQE